MKRELLTLVVVLILSTPIVSAAGQQQTNMSSNTQTTPVRCAIDGKDIEKDVPLSLLENLCDLGARYKADFLIIYDKTASEDDVALSLVNITPFFEALREKGLTDKTVDEFRLLFYEIREKIHEPRRQPVWKPQQEDDARPLGLWNGIPTPVWANMMCGVFDAGLCMGFAAGTHLIIPTVGIDAFLTYGFNGESISVGFFGGTLAITAFQVIIGFVGILLCTPLMMAGPYFMTGMCGFMLGIGA